LYSELIIDVNVMHRIPLVPVFGFGENDIYNQVANPVGSRLRRLQTLLMKLLSFSPPLFHGRGVLPFRHPVNVVGQFILCIISTQFLILKSNLVPKFLDCRLIVIIEAGKMVEDFA